MNCAGWFSLFFSCFVLLYYMVGMYVSRKTITESDYFLAGRSLGFWSLTGTLLATQIGSGLTLGIAQDSYRYGIPGLLYGVGIAVGFVVLGLGAAGRLRGLQVATTAEIFEKYFASPTLKKIASLLSIISLTGIFMAQVLTSKSVMLGMGVYNEGLFIAVWAALIGYTMYGGLPAVVATDLLQLTVIVTILSGLFGYLVWGGAVPWSAGSAVSAVYAVPAGGFAYWFAYLGMPCLISLVEQDLAQRFFSARTSAIARASAWAAAAGVLGFTLIPALIGMHAKLIGMPVAAGENPLIVLISYALGPIGQALVMCALVAAITSTADSLLCAITSNVVQDFVPVLWKSSWRMISAKVATVVVGVVAVVGSYYCTNILGVLIQSYELLVSSILVSVVVCLFNGPLTYRAAVCSVLSGFCMYTVLWLGIIEVSVPHSLGALCVSAAGYGVGLVSSRMYKK
jgi:SSS family solute:Na+ symporter